MRGLFCIWLGLLCAFQLRSADKGAVALQPTVSVSVVGAEGVKVKGAKAYSAGKKVSLSIKIPRGYVFLGWARGDEPFPDAASCANPKLKFTMPESDLDLTAGLRIEEVLVECVSVLTCELKQPVTIPIDIACESSVKSVKAKGLPSGLKYNKKSNAITGAAKKTGTFAVTITVQTKAGSEVVRTMRLDVDDPVSSAIGQCVGTYEGDTVTEYSWGEQEPGTVSFTLKADGKIKGSYTVSWDGSTTPFSGTVSRIDAEGCLIAEVGAKVDGHKVAFLIEIMPDGRAWFSGTISAEERMYTDVLKKVRTGR